MTLALLLVDIGDEFCLFADSRFETCMAFRSCDDTCLTSCRQWRCIMLLVF